jgi:hypothetical protein
VFQSQPVVSALLKERKEGGVARYKEVVELADAPVQAATLNLQVVAGRQQHDTTGSQRR